LFCNALKVCKQTLALSTTTSWPATCRAAVAGCSAAACYRLCVSNTPCEAWLCETVEAGLHSSRCTCCCRRSGLWRPALPPLRAKAASTRVGAAAHEREQATSNRDLAWSACSRDSSYTYNIAGVTSLANRHGLTPAVAWCSRRSLAARLAVCKPCHWSNCQTAEERWAARRHTRARLRQTVPRADCATRSAAPCWLRERGGAAAQPPGRWAGEVRQ